MISIAKDRLSRLPRQWSNRVLQQIAPHFKGHVINVSGWDDRDKEGKKYREYFSGCDSYSISNYVGTRGTAEDAGATDVFIDLIQPLAADLERGFDVVFNHTTLEHIFDVKTAFANLCRMSKDVVVVVVPFAQVTHPNDSFGDYWRFCPMALREMFHQNEFSIIYEAHSPHKNAGTYLLIAGTRNPERWYNVLPDYEPIDLVGGWIGNTFRRRIIQRIVAVRNRLFKGKGVSK